MTVPPTTPASMPRMVSFGVLVATIGVIAVWFYRLMSGFLLPLFLAALLVIVFRPLHRWLVVKCRGRERIAAALTTLSVMLLVLAPTVLLVTLAALEGRHLLEQLKTKGVRERLEEMKRKFELHMPLADDDEDPLWFIQETLALLFEETAPGKTMFDHDREWAEIDRRVRVVDPQVNPDGLAPEKLEDTEDPVVRRWLEFRGALADIHHEPSGRVVYRHDLEHAIRRFREFKVELLGGPRLAWLKEVANASDEQLYSLRDRLLSADKGWLLSLGGATTEFGGKLVFGWAITLIAFYFYLVDGPKMIQAVMSLSPMDDAHEAELLAEFDRISRAVLLATLLSAIAQGLLSGIGFYFAGLGSVFLLTFLATVLAMVPFVGAAAVWVPACLWLYFYDGRFWPAVLLAAFGVTVISTVDNIIKPLVLHGQSNLHPLLALLSVLGGVGALGPIGILVGPMVVAFLQTLLGILKREMTTWDAGNSKETAETGEA